MTGAHAAGASAPRVAVLMATYDGMRFIDEQIDSILGQHGVDVTIVASDDGSRDGTGDHLRDLAAREPRIRVLPDARSGSAGANFFRLVRAVDAEGFDAVGFSDQDDVWELDKLARHVAILAAGAAAVSSNVTAFDEHGSRTLVRKDHPQRSLDFVFESGGPGSTFLLRPDAYGFVQRVVRDDARVDGVDLHDWLVYALVRARALPWTIDHASTVRYRQHGANVVGANRGLRAAAWRFGRIRQGWHREQATRIADIALDVADDAVRASLEPVVRALHGTANDRRRLHALAGELRRDPKEQAAIRVLLRTGLW